MLSRRTLLKGLLAGVGASALYSLGRRDSDDIKTPRTVRLGLLGDSITAAGTWDTLLNHTVCFNFGVPGDTTAQMLARLPSVYNSGTTLCLINGGKNDVEAEIPPSIISDTMIHIAKNLHEHNIKPVIIATFKCGTNAGNYALLNQSIQQIGSELKNKTAQHKIDYIDLNPTMAPEGILIPAFTSDGTHFTSAGYAQWASLIQYWLKHHGY